MTIHFVDNPLDLVHRWLVRGLLKYLGQCTLAPVIFFQLNNLESIAKAPVADLLKPNFQNCFLTPKKNDDTRSSLYRNSLLQDSAQMSSPVFQQLTKE